MKKTGLVIAIDGPSGAGKSTAARILAQRLNYIYIDTGALYRSLGWKAKKEQVDPNDEQQLAKLCSRTEVTIKKDNNDPRFYVDGFDVTGEIRTPDMGMMASAVSKSPAVRMRLLALQRMLGAQGGVVMDGRDIGTVVFPDADIKFYLDASAEERGRRRWQELSEKGMKVDRAVITEEIRARDLQDSSREIAPLKRAPDARYLDSSDMTIDEVLREMLSALAGEERTVTWKSS